MVANEWKDANDKVMPVKQWLEERRFLQVVVLIFFFGQTLSFLLAFFELSVFGFTVYCNCQTVFLQGEMQQLRDKLAIIERAAKSEAQLKVIIQFCNQFQICI